MISIFNFQCIPVLFRMNIEVIFEIVDASKGVATQVTHMRCRFIVCLRVPFQARFELETQSTSFTLMLGKKNQQDLKRATPK